MKDRGARHFDNAGLLTIIRTLAAFRREPSREAYRMCKCVGRHSAGQGTETAVYPTGYNEHQPVFGAWLRFARQFSVAMTTITGARLAAFRPSILPSSGSAEYRKLNPDGNHIQSCRQKGQLNQNNHHRYPKNDIRQFPPLMHCDTPRPTNHRQHAITHRATSECDGQHSRRKKCREVSSGSGEAPPLDATRTEADQAPRPRPRNPAPPPARGACRCWNWRELDANPF
jgi:hypothetical protein